MTLHQRTSLVRSDIEKNPTESSTFREIWFGEHASEL